MWSLGVEVLWTEKLQGWSPIEARAICKNLSILFSPYAKENHKPKNLSNNLPILRSSKTLKSDKGADAWQKTNIVRIWVNDYRTPSIPILDFQLSTFFWMSRSLPRILRCQVQVTYYNLLYVPNIVKIESIRCKSMSGSCKMRMINIENWWLLNDL